MSISPLDDLAGLGHGPGSQITFANLVEPEIASCMGAQGFEYSALVRDGDHAAPTDPHGAIAWAETWGYGLLSVVPADANGTNKAARHANGDYVDGLDDERRAVYAEALRGCQEAARVAAGGEFWFLNTAIRMAVEDARGVVANDPEMVVAARAWGDCMEAHGLPGDHLEAGRALFNDAFERGSSDPEDVEYEKVVASVDARCRFETLWPVQAALEQQQVESIIAAVSGVRR